MTILFTKRLWNLKVKKWMPMCREAVEAAIDSNLAILTLSLLVVKNTTSGN